MKKGLVFYALLSIIIFTFFLIKYNSSPQTVELMSDPEPGLQVGILDMELLLQESQRAQQLQQELSAIGKELEERYKQEAEIVSVNNQQQQELNSIYQEYLDTKQRMEKELVLEINQLIKGKAKDKELDIVIFKSSVYYGGIDLTNQIIEKLDQKLLEGDDQDNE